MRNFSTKVILLLLATLLCGCRAVYYDVRLKDRAERRPEGRADTADVHLVTGRPVSIRRLCYAMTGKHSVSGFLTNLFDAGMFWGLTNQKACVRSALAMAMQKGWAFVIPWWRVAYSPHNFDPHKSLIEPLSFMYNMSTLAEWASERR